MVYLRALRKIVQERGSQSLVYVDESGFAAHSHRVHGWGKKGQKVYGSASGNARPRTSLIAAQQGRKLLAPVLFEGSTNAEWFNQWLTQHLFQNLPQNATVILDNAAFHKTSETRRIMEDSPFQLLYLPPYSPDLNPIEKAFATLKKRRQFAPLDTPLDHLVKTFDSYLE
jgi:transposase